jgi:hypothetical protein
MTCCQGQTQYAGSPARAVAGPSLPLRADVMAGRLRRGNFQVLVR